MGGAAGTLEAGTSAGGLLPDAPPSVSGPALVLEQGAFALADSSGGNLIGLDSLPEPARIRSAVCAGAIVLPVTYVTHQAGRPDSARGRATAATFRYLTGPLFKVSAGEAPAGATCYVTADSALVGAAVPVKALDGDACDTSLVLDLAVANERSVASCFRLGAARPHVFVVGVQYVVHDSSALASVAVVDHGRILLQDFPARYRGPDEDIWRADDGGAFTADGFDVLFLARLSGVEVLGLLWAGSEGENSYLLAADSAASFRTIAHTYRYWTGF